MSRGLGPLQKAILQELSTLEDRYTLELAVLAYNIPPRGDGRFPYEAVTKAQHTNTRRALLALERRGLVFRKPGRSSQGEVIWMDREHARDYARRELETSGAQVLMKYPRLLELARGKRAAEASDWLDFDLPLPI
jgi:hypothetical protein